MPAHWTEETALKGRGHRSLGRRWRRVSTRSVIGRGPSRDGTGAVIGRWDPAAAARNPRKVSASCMGRRRRRVDRGAAVGALPEAIAALSRTLPAGPSPEIFRRAKFDRPEAAPALWQLLFRVLSPLSANGASAPPAQGEPPSTEAQVRVVKSELHSQGYPRRALAQLPEDGSQGSRELLLALAWLLARGPLLERLLAQTRVRLGDEIPLCECEALARPGPPVPRVEADGPVDIRHLQWLMGKLRFQWRKLITSQQEQCALLGKGTCSSLSSSPELCRSGSDWAPVTPPAWDMATSDLCDALRPDLAGKPSLSPRSRQSLCVLAIVFAGSPSLSRGCFSHHPDLAVRGLRSRDARFQFHRTPGNWAGWGSCRRHCPYPTLCRSLLQGPGPAPPRCGLLS
ncbi:tubulin epsilon and delta complex protein 1 isoform X6 [Prionailurus viverrinus]|uniref:tubulin epsilon and delta complex protein 1 isoform X6 n=1 Tax=Prionailurus viverrinus TaxID=61388 RepID=UPI001FF24A8F|nr:tubulin epsilon and delta complex protein 1 isoform X6 [Prionailurus viverrinus]